METITYSIIIPHYNIPKLLERCLSSIPQRTDVQIIVVDDNSEEEQRAIVEEIAKRFSDVLFVFSSEGLGAGHARNIGLSKAEGKYVLFADADDYFNYCFNQVLDDYADSEYDAIYFDANAVDTDTYKNAYRSIQLNRFIKMYDKHPDKAVFNLKYAFGEPWCKMVRRDIIMRNGIAFSETIIHNDTKYSYLVGYYCSNICVDKRAIYCVTDRVASTSKSISTERLYVRTEVFAEANRFFKEHNIKRFDHKALRPLLRFLSEGKMENAKQCIRILTSYGMPMSAIFYRMLQFPFYVCTKAWRVKYKLLAD